MNEPRAAFQLDLSNNRHWRLLLAVLFAMTLLCRFLIHGNLVSHPVGLQEQWPGTESWLSLSIADRAVTEGDWLLAGPGILFTREMAAWMPMKDWNRLSDSRLPRGAGSIFLIAVSFTLTKSLGLYTALSLLAGGALAVAAALAGEQLFACRRAGVLAGIVVACHGSLALAGVLVGPWQWEALVLAVLLWLVPGLRADQPGARWLLAGLVLALGLWLRGAYWWGVAGAAVLVWRQRPPLRMTAALLIPVLIAAGAMYARNSGAGAPRLPAVGFPAWDFLETTNPASTLRPALPPDATLFQSSRGKFSSAIKLALGDPEYRGALLPNLQRKFRELLGARDQTATFNPDYLRRRTELLRVMTLPTGVTMALGWAALILLLVRRRMPAELAATLGLVLLHGLLFRTSGMERGLLHLVLAIAAGGALAECGAGLRAGAKWPLLFVVLWAGMQWLLAVDDQSRGPRFRANEFNQAAQFYRRLGKDRLAEAELLDYREIRLRDQVLTNYWNAER